MSLGSLSEETLTLFINRTWTLARWPFVKTSCRGHKRPRLGSEEDTTGNELVKGGRISSGAGSACAA